MTAVCAPHPHVVIRASAGTGKTFQLTKRYLSLLNAGASPAQILAVTFTRKAAGEILDRLLVGLAEAAHTPAALQALQQHMTGPVLDRRRCVDLLQVLLRDLHQLQISTLDSFFIQIARGLALELGLPVDWQIVEDLDDQRLRMEAMQAFLAEDALADLVHLLRLLSKGEAPRSVVGVLDAVATISTRWPSRPMRRPGTPSHARSLCAQRRWKQPSSRLPRWSLRMRASRRRATAMLQLPVVRIGRPWSVKDWQDA